jgi:hypothetical protein
MQRELRTKPQKALILLALVAGAGYFWLPIAKRWMGFKAGKTAVASKSVIRDDARPQKSGKKAAAKGQPWDMVQQALSGDPLTQSAGLSALSGRNPFQKAPEEEAQPTDEEIAAELAEKLKEKPDAKPSELGVVLKSIISGPQGRMAFVAGDVVSVGDRFHVAKDEAGNAVASFDVVEINPLSIVIARNGQQYELALPQPSLRRSDKIVRQLPPGSNPDAAEETN